ncbi:pentapeptide repeat-containing protein [Actinomadura sp. K4S16]|uniref:pentapeptide repeat-containing protein n=1 Tax=Actinomadura sp. K4S16 TaxID=1316147 RepID=UPI00135C4115|nr:pentapeptide repeat-containing protein [Actinomadura sp. K4S16]
MQYPSQAELDALPADRRLELLELERQRQESARDRRRQSIHQWINSGVLLIGVLLAGGSLIVTAFTFRIGQQEQRTAREGQITDRYTRAVEQLGSAKRDVRTAAVYALERIAADSPRDRTTVRDVLAAFVREHDPSPAVEDNKLPTEPDTDVHAALAVLARRAADSQTAGALDLHAIRTPGAGLSAATLTNANLTSADLAKAHMYHADPTSANLIYADPTSANLIYADPTSANLIYADLTSADLTDANLTSANLPHANLTRATLYQANLADANLTGADLSLSGLSKAYLREADLTGADLRYANLVGADLEDANLSGARLADALWTRDTEWPDSVGGVAGMQDRSDPAGPSMGEGYFRVRA